MPQNLCHHHSCPYIPSLALWCTNTPPSISLLIPNATCYCHSSCCVHEYQHQQPSPIPKHNHWSWDTSSHQPSLSMLCSYFFSWISNVPCDHHHHPSPLIPAIYQRKMPTDWVELDHRWPPSQDQRVDALSERRQWMPPNQWHHHPRLLTTMKIEVLIFGFGPLEGA